MVTMSMNKQNISVSVGNELYKMKINLMKNESNQERVCTSDNFVKKNQGLQSLNIVEATETVEIY